MSPIEELKEFNQQQAARRRAYIDEAHRRMLEEDTIKQVAEFSEQFSQNVNDLVAIREKMGANTPEYFLAITMDHLLHAWSELRSKKELV